ncbi:MAG: TylF/MycF/NovP-related O-methyltransferase [Solirubrobacterales bacterium]
MRIPRLQRKRDPAIPPHLADSVAHDLATADPSARAIVEQALPHSMTGVARMLATVDAVRHCVRREIPGPFAECGVWRGGSVLAMLLTLRDLGIDDRDVYLYDTFEGMTEPTEHDTSQFHRPAVEEWHEAEREGVRLYDDAFDPESFNEEVVRENIGLAGYPQSRLHLVKGPVEATIPDTVPDRLALLRLDTDWYESTLHELQHLYPLLSPGGVLIVDDYGHWEGARRAVDEYFEGQDAPLLSRIDYTGRIAVKA